MNITNKTIKNSLINLIKIEKYVQQFEGASLINRGSLLIGLVFMLINIYRFVFLQNIVSKTTVCG